MKNLVATPFVKWAGGKRQLLPIIKDNLPIELKENKINKYIEPFVGGGAVLFGLIPNYDFEEIIINDYNEDLINLYNHIKLDVYTLISKLKIISENYLNLNSETRIKFYYDIRDLYNETPKGTIEKSTYFIFLNKTCFNGLYRVNSRGGFNVPHGRYKNPMILDEENLLNVSMGLSKVKILSGDFTNVEKFVDDKTFVYFDPPYRPLNATSSFTSYVKYDFDDNEQIRLCKFFNKLNSTGAKLMLSNSDPKNTDENDDFFDNLYSKYRISRVDAKRNINSNSNGRGKISELLITNY